VYPTSTMDNVVLLYLKIKCLKVKRCCLDQSLTVGIAV